MDNAMRILKGEIILFDKKLKVFFDYFKNLENSKVILDKSDKDTIDLDDICITIF